MDARSRARRLRAHESPLGPSSQVALGLPGVDAGVHRESPVVHGDGRNLRLRTREHRGLGNGLQALRTVVDPADHTLEAPAALSPRRRHLCPGRHQADTTSRAWLAAVSPLESFGRGVTITGQVHSRTRVVETLPISTRPNGP